MPHAGRYSVAAYCMPCTACIAVGCLCSAQQKRQPTAFQVWARLQVLQGVACTQHSCSSPKASPVWATWWPAPRPWSVTSVAAASHLGMGHMHPIMVAAAQL